MVYTPRRYLIPAAVALVALQTQQAAASSLYYDPVTTANTTDEISNKFPARGGKVADADCAITVEVDPTLPNITTISTATVTYTELLANMTSAPTEAVSTKVGTTIVQESTPSTGADQDAYTTTTSTSTSTSSTQSTSTQTSSTSSSSGTTTSSQTKTGTTVSQTSTSTSTSTTTKTGTATTSAPTTTESTTTPISPSKTGTTTTTTDAPAATTSSDVGGVSDEEPNCATGWDDQSSRKLRHAPMSGRRLQEKLEKKRHLEANTNTDIAKLETYFGTSMETTLANLPTLGVHTPSPWPGPYWPTYQDSINVVWSSGEPSAAEKYATAFGLDVTDFMDKVSADNGIDSMSSHTVCSSDSDCSSLTDGSSCAIRADKSSGYCIPTWYGICHAWTPAAMLEDEPQCAVTHNGVTFQPMDLKALLSDIYDGATVSTVFTGTRYNGGTDTTDEYGRHSSDSYRDLNPAYFHIAAANLLGNLNATFIADVTAGSEVWNQPVRGFKVYEQTAMSLEDAAQTFYGLEEYPWNAAAKSIVYVKTRLSWIFETYTDGPLVSSGKVDSYTTGAYYYYLLEMDDAGAIIGGEWVYDSDDDHPDFIWFPKAKPAADTVTSIGLSYADVSMLLAKSVACSGSSSGSESAGSAGSSASASASGSTAASASEATVASTSGSTSSSAVSSLSSSASTGSAPFTSGTVSTTGSENAATVAPVTEAPVVTEAPTATESSTSTSTTTPASTTATPVSTTATPASTTANTGNNRNEDSDDNQQQGQRQSWQSFFHWW
uniref:Transglutaminase elicitor n=1 Tax=Phytophthora ramorum TaxID=164328 RepID=H3GZF6_PHYRM